MRKKIDVQILDKQILDYFDIKTNITEENFLRIIIAKSGKIINNWVRFKYSFYHTNYSKSEDIINIVYSKLLNICFIFDSSKGIPFINYFYKSIKINILNEFGKIKSKQQLFENKLTWFSESAIESFNNLTFHSYSGEKYQEIKKDAEIFFKSLSKKEIIYLKRRNSKSCFYSSNKVNLFIESLRNKAEKFFK